MVLTDSNNHKAQKADKQLQSYLQYIYSIDVEKKIKLSVGRQAIPIFHVVVCFPCLYYTQFNRSHAEL